MALNKNTLQTLDSPRLRPLQMKSLVGLTAGQLRKQVEVEKQEISQLRGQLRIEMSAAMGKADFDNSITIMPQGIGLSERQELVRELQELRRQKMEIVEQIKAVRENPTGIVSALEKSLKAAARLERRLEIEIKKKKKREERERKKQEREEKRKQKQEEKKDKIWNQKNLRKGSVSGERANKRIQRFFDNEKIDQADKDRLRNMLNDISFYESDEVFQILSLMESKAFDSMEEAEEFLTDFYHIQKGQSAALERFYDSGGVVDFDEAASNIEDMAEDFNVNTGLGLRF